MTITFWFKAFAEGLTRTSSLGARRPGALGAPAKIMEEPPKKKFEGVGDARDRKRKMARRSRDSDSESPVPDSDDKTTTAGGDATILEFSTGTGSDIVSLANWTGTLQVAEDEKSKEKGGSGSDGAYDSLDENDKVRTSCSSKMSNARNEKHRGPARYQRNHQRTLDHLKAQGIEYSGTLTERQSRAGAERATGQRGSASMQSYDDVVHTMSVPMSEEERKLKMEEDLRQTDTIQDEQQFIEMCLGGPFCLLCEKEATPGHLDSGRLKLKKEEHAVWDAHGWQSRIDEEIERR
jgi:hypothetical protein